MFLFVVILSGCGNNKDLKGNDNIGKENIAATDSDAENKSSESENLPGETTTDLWQQMEEKSEDNVLEFVTGLQIVLPKEWDDKIVIHTEPTVQSYGGGGIVCEKKNAKANAGGVLFLLEYFMYDEDATAPYEIFQNDKVLGVYHSGKDVYALVFELPREMNYVEGNEEI